MPPWGVPVAVTLVTPSSERMPAFRKALTSARTRLSPTRLRTRSTRAECEISSKEVTTHYPPQGLSRDGVHSSRTPSTLRQAAGSLRLDAPSWTIGAHPGPARRLEELGAG